MAFKSYENDGGTMPEGDYEVICLKALETTARNDYPCVAFDFQVRSDVEQKYQKKHIFKNFYQSEETGEYNYKKIGKFANALGIPKGEEFELSDLVGRCCILHMRPYTNKDGATYDSIYFPLATKAGQMVQETAKPKDPDGFVEVEDEDLPF